MRAEKYSTGHVSRSTHIPEALTTKRKQSSRSRGGQWQRNESFIPDTTGPVVVEVEDGQPVSTASGTTYYARSSSLPRSSPPTGPVGSGSASSHEIPGGGAGSSGSAGPVSSAGNLPPVAQAITALANLAPHERAQ
eukprot:4766849-Amphidinium_carterae.1